MTQNMIRSIQIDWSRIPGSSYLHQIKAISGVESIELTHPVTFFVGENGTGKSTLLEALALASGFNPEGGTKNYSFSTYDSCSELYSAIRLIRNAGRSTWGYFLRAESFYNVATQEEEYGKDSGRGPKYYHHKSHGESFLAVAQDNFQPGGIYLLDEPEAALSPQRQLTLLAEIHRCAAHGAQFVIVTHSPILLAMPGAQILSFDEGPVHPVSYEETDSYRITSLFLRDRNRILDILLNDEEEG